MGNALRQTLLVVRSLELTDFPVNHRLSLGSLPPLMTNWLIIEFLSTVFKTQKNKVEMRTF